MPINVTFNLTFNNYENLVNFVENLKGLMGKADVPVTTPTAHTPSEPTAAPSIPAPTQQPTPPVAAATQPAMTAAPPVPQATQPSIPQPAPQSTPQPVQTSTVSYTSDDLARAAMTLMDKGMQAQLQQLLSQFGVQSLPELPPEQFGAFATALRGMGAQI